MTEPTEPTPTRSIEQAVEVAGTPEEVWAAIATGPGITAWFVPTTVEGRVGGAIHQRFGADEAMHVEGRVTAWDPPHRFAFGEDTAGSGMAFEFLVEASDGGSCVVRLVNSGFGHGADWDGEYDSMEQGWRLFLHNLQLHLEHFPGRCATAILPMAMAAGRGGREAVWAEVAEALGLPVAPSPGERVAAGPGAPAPLAGTVARWAPPMLSLVLDEPAAGTGFIAVEGGDDVAGVSVWLYLYGDEGAAAAERDLPRWQAWLDERFPAPAAQAQDR